MANQLTRVTRLLVNGKSIWDMDLPKRMATCAYCGAAFQTYQGAITELSGLPEMNSPVGILPLAHCGSTPCHQADARRQENLFHGLVAIEHARKERDAAKQEPDSAGTDGKSHRKGRKAASALLPHEPIRLLRSGEVVPGSEGPAPADSLPDEPW